MYCIYVWRPIMEAISTLENIRPPVVSRWSQKVNNCLRLQCQNILLYIIIEYSLTIWNIANVHVVKHNSVYNSIRLKYILLRWVTINMWIILTTYLTNILCTSLSHIGN